MAHVVVIVMAVLFVQRMNSEARRATHVLDAKGRRSEVAPNPKVASNRCEVTAATFARLQVNSYNIFPRPTSTLYGRL